MFIDELKQRVIKALIDLNNGQVTQDLVVADINRAIDEISERVTLREDIANYVVDYILRHFKGFAGQLQVADRLSPRPALNVLSLIEVCEEVGSVATSNGSFQDMLALQLSKRSLEEMPVGELLDVIRAGRQFYNSIYGPKGEQPVGYDTLAEAVGRANALVRGMVRR